MRSSLAVSIFSYALAFCIAIFYWILRIGFLDNSVVIVFRVLGISAFILFFPVGFSYIRNAFTAAVNKVFFNDAILLVISLAIIAISGYLTSLLRVNFSILFVTAGYAFLTIAVYRFFKEGSLLNKALLIIIAAFFGLWTGAACWMFYLKPFILEGWANGTDKIDTLFHIAVAQMVRTHGVPTAGLDGLSFMNYHWGSHWFFAQLSNLLDLPVIVVYQLCYPVVIAPLFFRIFLSFVIEVKQYCKPEIESRKFNLFFWIIFMSISIGFFKSFFAGNKWAQFATAGAGEFVFMFVSESYNFSIIIMFGILSACLNFWIHKNHLKSGQQFFFLFCFLPAWLGILGWIKISTLFIVCCLIGYLFLRFKMYRSKMLLAGIVMQALIALVIFKLVFETKESHGGLSLLYFYKSYNISFPLFLILFFIWTYIFIGVFFYKEVFRKISFNQILNVNNSILLEIVLVVAVAGLLPSVFLRIQHYDSLYFSEMQLWFASAFVLVYIPFYNTGQINSKVKLLLISACSVFLCVVFFINTRSYALNVIADSVGHYNFLLDIDKDTNMKRIRIRNIYQLYSARQSQLPVGYTENKALVFLQKLKDLDDLSFEEKRKTLVYVNFRELLSRPDYEWKLYCHNIPLIVPSLTGMAMIDGIDTTYFGMCGDCCEDNIEFVYGYFPKWKTEEQINKPVSISDLCERVRKKGFENLIIYNLDTESFETLRCK